MLMLGVTWHGDQAKSDQPPSAALSLSPYESYWEMECSDIKAHQRDKWLTKLVGATINHRRCHPFSVTVIFLHQGSFRFGKPSFISGDSTGNSLTISERQQLTREIKTLLQTTGLSHQWLWSLIFMNWSILWQPHHTGKTFSVYYHSVLEFWLLHRVDTSWTRGITMVAIQHTFAQRNQTKYK